MAYAWQVPLAATPLAAIGLASVANPSWVTGVLFGALLALYVVAVGKWLTGRTAGRRSSTHRQPELEA